MFLKLVSCLALPAGILDGQSPARMASSFCAQGSLRFATYRSRVSDAARASRWLGTSAIWQFSFQFLQVFTGFLVSGNLGNLEWEYILQIVKGQVRIDFTRLNLA